MILINIVQHTTLPFHREYENVTNDLALELRFPYRKDALGKRRLTFICHCMIDIAHEVENITELIEMVGNWTNTMNR